MRLLVCFIQLLFRIVQAHKLCTDGSSGQIKEPCDLENPNRTSKTDLRVPHTEPTVLSGAMAHDREAAIHMLTSPDGLVLCPYHTFTNKYCKITGFEAPREHGLLHCGCREDDVLLEIMLRKFTVVPCQDSAMKEDFLNPQDRTFFCWLLGSWNLLSTEDMRGSDGHGRMRSYEGLLRAQVAWLQKQLTRIEAKHRENDLVTDGSL